MSMPATKGEYNIKEGGEGARLKRVWEVPQRLETAQFAAEKR